MIQFEFTEITRMNRLMAMFFAPFTVVGFVFYAMGPDLMVLIPSIFFFVLTLYILIHKQGVQIDPQKQRIREYKTHFGLVTGKWKDLNDYKCIVFLSKKRKHKKLFGFNVLKLLGLQEDQEVHEIHLMDQNHFKRQFVTYSIDPLELNEIAVELKKQLNLPIEEYDPISKRALKN